MTLSPTSLEHRVTYGQSWFSARLKGISVLPSAEIGHKLFLPSRNDNNRKDMPSIDNVVLFCYRICYQSVSLPFYITNCTKMFAIDDYKSTKTSPQGA